MSLRGSTIDESIASIVCTFADPFERLPKTELATKYATTTLSEAIKMIIAMSDFFII
jgi:hypothetical protein